MKTTIIMPNYNGLSFMEPCLEALEKQTTKDFKILVVDNGRIAERGTHAELMQQDGVYMRFIEIREKAEGWRIAG